MLRRNRALEYCLCVDISGALLFKQIACTPFVISNCLIKTFYSCICKWLHLFSIKITKTITYIPLLFILVTDHILKHTYKVFFLRIRMKKGEVIRLSTEKGVQYEYYSTPLKRKISRPTYHTSHKRDQACDMDHDSWGSFGNRRVRVLR